jgi:acyl-CoA reductase-like NAD-dependent aldehyde dehydrogenase
VCWVWADADVAQAVNTCAFASFVATGQTCVTGARLLVHESLLEEVRRSMGRVFGSPGDRRWEEERPRIPSLYL